MLHLAKFCEAEGVAGCPKCPVIFVPKSPISFEVNELDIVWFVIPDIVST